MLTKCTALFSLTWSASWVYCLVQSYLISKLSVLPCSVLPYQQAECTASFSLTWSASWVYCLVQSHLISKLSALPCSVSPDQQAECTASFSLTWSASWVYCIVSSSLTAIFFHIAIHFISLSTLKFIKMTPVLNPRPWEKATSYQLIGV